MWLHAALHRPCMHAIIITINHHLVNCAAFITQAFKRKRCTQLQRSSWQSPCLSAFKSTNTKSTKKSQSQIGLAGLLVNQTSLQITRQIGLFNQENIGKILELNLTHRVFLGCMFYRQTTKRLKGPIWFYQPTGYKRRKINWDPFRVYLSPVSWVPLNPLKSLQMTVL